MTKSEIAEKVRSIRELQALIEEAQAEADSLKDEIKAEMDEQGTDELIVDMFKVRYTTVTSSRFDSAAFKRTHADLYGQYTNQTTSCRFSIA